MESDRRLKKVCPQCDTTVPARRAVCVCGHTFPSKGKCIEELYRHNKRILREQSNTDYVNRAQGQLKRTTKFQPGETA